VLPDERTSRWAARFLVARAGTKQPFFLLVGLHAAHSPYVVSSSEFFRAAPTSSFSVDVETNDLEDLPDEALALLVSRRADASPAQVAQLRRGWRDGEASRAMEQVHGYHARMAEADAHVGSVVGELDRSGLANSTVVILTSDHGVHLGEKLQQIGNKWTLWEPTSHVPLVVRMPPAFSSPVPRGTSGGTYDVAVSLVDIFPTVAELAGVDMREINAGLAGRSLVPLLRALGTEAASEPAVGQEDEERAALVVHCPGAELLGFVERRAERGQRRQRGEWQQ
jgi:arylsulfatase A-like enzyme